jgi:hypothetical protein
LLDTSGSSVPILNVDGEVLAKYLEYVNKRKEFERNDGRDKAKNIEADLKGWDEEFMKDLGLAMVFELMLVNKSCIIWRFDLDYISRRQKALFGSKSCFFCCPAIEVTGAQEYKHYNKGYEEGYLSSCVDSSTAFRDPGLVPVVGVGNGECRDIITQVT